MRFTDRVVSLHPAVITGLIVALFALGGLVSQQVEFASPAYMIVYSLSTFALTAPLLLWHYSLYRAASDRAAPVVGHKGRRVFLFVVAGAFLSLFLIAVPLQVGPLANATIYRAIAGTSAFAMLVGVPAYFASVWAAANALVRFDQQNKKSKIESVLGTAFLEFYLPIGVWFIYPRIKRMLAVPIPT